MSEIKRRGQIVPKCFVKSIEKKAQHLATFGCDVIISRSNKRIEVLTDGHVFCVSGQRHVLKKRNQRSVKGFLVNEVLVIGLNKIE